MRVMVYPPYYSVLNSPLLELRKRFGREEVAIQYADNPFVGVTGGGGHHFQGRSPPVDGAMTEAKDRGRYYRCRQKNAMQQDQNGCAALPFDDVEAAISWPRSKASNPM
jgi:hypothetical protein